MAVRGKESSQDLAATVFARVWAAVADRLSPSVARQVISLSFTEHDKARMGELASRNAEGKLSRAEADELDGYIRAGDMIAILQSSARRRLRTSTNGHG